jgi:DNA replication and repair protein RecF
MAYIHYKEIAAGQKLNILYQPSLSFASDASNREQIESAFWIGLEKYRQREAIMQNAMIGPHRDELEIIIDNLPARTHASQGELRSAAISLKLAVYDYLSSVRQIQPVLLLDEILAELDNNRKNMLLGMFNKFGQIFLTTAGDIPENLVANARIFNIEDGVITKR